jgi:hypothetical protein
MKRLLLPAQPMETMPAEDYFDRVTYLDELACQLVAHDRRLAREEEELAAIAGEIAAKLAKVMGQRDSVVGAKERVRRERIALGDKLLV